MLTFRRAVAAAALVLTILFLFTQIHSDTSLSPLDSAAAEKQRGTEHASTTASHPKDSSSKSSKSSNSKKPSSQQPLVDPSTLSLPDKLAYHFPYDLPTKFPAYIWQTWKHTPASGNFAETLRPAEASWSEKHPGFVHEVITDAVALHLLRYLYAALPEVLQAYEALPLPILKADFFRYLILLARGGIYTDIDTHALRSALDWIPASVPHEAVGLVVGIEVDAADREDWAEWYSRRIQMCQWTIQAKPGHPVLRSIVARITEETLRRQKAGSLHVSDDKVVEFTGPAVWTDVVFDYFNDEKFFEGVGNITWRDFTGMKGPKKVGDVVVLPITSFSPGVQTMGSGEYDDPMAFVKHEFEGSWKPENLRHIGIVYDGTENEQIEEAEKQAKLAKEQAQKQQA
ncbi:alpha-1,6-mannosyltransferase Och1 [Pseudogymnoascus australis]